MRKLFSNAKEQTLLLIQVIPWGISFCKVWSSDKVLALRDHSSHLLRQAQHVHGTFLSATHNSLILLAAVTPTRSVPLVYKMPFQIKLLFSLIKHHIWAKTASLIQLNPHCLHLLFGAEHTEISSRLRCLVKQTPVSCIEGRSNFISAAWIISGPGTAMWIVLPCLQ